MSNCPGRGPGYRSPRPRWARRAAVVITTTASMALLAAACSTGSGGSSTPGAANGPAATTGGLLPYSSCIRSHGVPNFPDPTGSGGIPKETPQQLGVSTAQLQAAQNDCKHLLPAGQSLSGKVTHTVTAQQQKYYIKAAACMRAHGITGFPEPVFSGGRVEFPRLQHLVDIHSTQFTRALQICHKLIPAGLPYSGSGG
jgi:hypothetical protein